MPGFSTQMIIRASSDRVWDTLADFGTISQWNPGILSSRLTSDVASGVGAARHCDSGRGIYLDESVVEWDPGRFLTVRIMKTNLPFQHADVRFALDEVDEGTVVDITTDYEVKYGWFGKAIDSLVLRRAFESAMGTLLNGLKDHLEEGHQ